MKYLFLLIFPFALLGCAGSGENGQWTSDDTRAALDATNSAITVGEHGYNDYNAVRHGAYIGQPAPTVIVR